MQIGEKKRVLFSGWTVVVGIEIGRRNLRMLSKPSSTRPKAELVPMPLTNVNFAWRRGSIESLME